MQYSADLQRLGLTHGISEIADGNLSYVWGETEAVLKNRRAFLEKLNLPLEKTVAMQVEHRDRIVVVDGQDASRGMKKIEDAIHADALITTELGLGLFLMVADCQPLILHEPNKVLALAHLGWRGVDLQLARKLVETMQGKLSSDVNNLHAFLGPSVKKNSFIIENPAQRQLPAWKPYLTDLPDGRTSIDIHGYNKQQLIEAGIPQHHIIEDGIDTVTSSNYFSHYRSVRSSEPEGRFAVATVL